MCVMSDVRRLMLDVSCLMTDIGRPMSPVRCLISNTCLMSDIVYQTSDDRLQMFTNRCHTSDV